jgi:hypothetical protein
MRIGFDEPKWLKKSLQPFNHRSEYHETRY